MVNFNVTGNRRKQLVKKLASLLGERAIYLGMPSTSYRVGPFEVSKTGEVSGAELSDDIKAALARAGFVPVSGTEEVAPADAPAEEPDGLVFTIPNAELDDKAVGNFENMLASKGALIQSAFGLSELPTKRTEDGLEIFWFQHKEPEDAKVAEKFVGAMIAKAKEQKYVSAKPLVADNMKFSFRVFLNALGFTGSEHKQLRKALLKNLPGSSAWRHPEARRVAK